MLAVMENKEEFEKRCKELEEREKEVREKDKLKRPRRNLIVNCKQGEKEIDLEISRKGVINREILQM